MSSSTRSEYDQDPTRLVLLNSKRSQKTKGSSTYGYSSKFRGKIPSFALFEESGNEAEAVQPVPVN